MRKTVDTLANAALTPVVVVGIGGHAAEVCSYLSLLSERYGRIKLMGCIDDHPAAEGFGLMNVLGDFQFLAELNVAMPELLAITATGDNVLRRLYVARVESLSPRPIGWLTLSHPLASVGPRVEIGAGSCLAPGSVITTRARIGRHCILNVNSSVSHDAVLGDFVNLNPGAVVAGGARIGDGSYLGAGATIVDKVTIGQGAVVGAGAVVLEDVPANATVVGVPARVIKYHTTSWEPVTASRRA